MRTIPQLVLAALGSTRDSSGSFYKIQLTCLSFPDDTSWQSPDWHFLTMMHRAYGFLKVTQFWPYYLTLV